MKHVLIFILALVAALTAPARIYVVGDGQGMTWDMSSPEAVEEDGGRYSFSVIAGRRFMVSTSTGGRIFFEADGLGAVIEAEDVGMTLPLEPMHKPTILPWTGDWSISISSDLKTIVVRTDTPRPPVFARLFVRGDMNGWAANPDWEFATADGTTYWFDSVGNTAIDAGLEFKIGDAGWTEYILGPADEKTVSADGQARRWILYGLDAAVSSDYRGTIRVDLNPSDRSAMVTFFPGYITHVGIAEPEAEHSPAKYYNFRGLPVSDPTPGHIYIRRTLSTTSKILVR